LHVSDAVPVNVLPPCRGCVAVIVTALLTEFMQVATPQVGPCVLLMETLPGSEVDQVTLLRIAAVIAGQPRLIGKLLNATNCC